MENENLRTTKELEVHYPSNHATSKNGAPGIIIIDESTPASNTRASRHQKLLSTVDVLIICRKAKHSTSRSYPPQFLADFAGDVLDNETGELLQYRHLIKRPKYKKLSATPLGMRLED